MFLIVYNGNVYLLHRSYTAFKTENWTPAFP